MAINVGINISGEASAIKKLEHLGATWGEWKEALDETGKGLKSYFGGRVFASQGGVFGTPWASLSPSTQAYKSLHYRQYAAVPLMATGTMKESFKYSATGTHLEITNEADYFKYHQSTAERSKLPRRPMFAINTDVKNIIKAAFHKAAMAKVSGL
jgi:hypothetical protein